METVHHHGKYQSHCTRIAVIAEMPEKAIYLPFADTVFIGKDGYRIGHLLAGADHIVEFTEKVNITCVFETHTDIA